MEFKNIILERKDGIARITIARPPLNVLDISTMEEMNKALEDIKRDEVSKVVVITGQGDRAFCAGVDVKDHTPERMDLMMEVFYQLLLHSLIEVGRPVVAAVNGAALGGGCELAISCDMIVASDNAQFGQPEIQLSLFPGPAVVALPRLIGKQKAFEMLLSGDPISAQEAERIGLVNKIIPKADFEQGVDEFVSRLKGKSLAALKLTRYAIYQARDLEHKKANQCVSDIYLGLLMHTEDAIEGISSFLEKRKPVWKNK